MAEDRPGPAARPPRPDDSPLAELLAREPSRASRRFLYLTLICFVLAVVAICVFSVDVVVSAPVTLLPEGKALLIQPDVEGVITSIPVREGDPVQAGDVLAVLQSEKYGEQLFALQSASMELRKAQRVRDVELRQRRSDVERQKQALRQRIERLSALREVLDRRDREEERQLALLCAIHEAEMRKQDDREAQLNIDATNAEENYKYRLNEARTLTELLKRQVVAEIEVLVARRLLEDAIAIKEKIRYRRGEAASERELLTRQYEKEVRQTQVNLLQIAEARERNEAEIQAAQGEILKLETELRQAELEAQRNVELAQFAQQQARQKAEVVRSPINRKRVEGVLRGTAEVSGEVLLTAPVAGRVGAIQARRLGEAVPRGQTLMHLLPQGELIAEARVANRDAGQVRPGQKVKLKMEAYPFPEFGVVPGEVLLVPPEAEQDERTGESFYRVRVRLDVQSVRKNGEPRPLSAGMTGTAEIITERKTLLRLLLTPLLEMKP